MTSASPLPSEVIHSVQSQSAVLFLGAAASYGARHPRNAEIPRAHQLRDALCDRFLGGEENSKPLTTVADLAINEASLVLVQQFISDLFNEFEPADFHLLIPRFRWHAIITTNYDLIVERAYEPRNKPLQELVSAVR
jgi:hypothetical protein